ncbi:TIGR03621 family F420-dependent LLM class oxidoreductase [Pseudonocardia parietis]|uniref:F420-dependent oxidoreductase n=1 Tax=Pseudonocardia parietis TaxID=570936 RepID=A0ABS4VRL9_9PSEU|nr:TIGR03621 family F420-dependent LLM class oxidoreductase [Pseudonocardia parietis]MBP2366561.1 putative F420-dependent oxidoreductase [Pseudonocardia parietis]
MTADRLDLGVLMMEPLTDAAQWRERIHRVEEAGATTLQVSDHFDRSPASPLLALAAAAQHTDRLRLGTLVLNNDFRHPAVLAKEVASLQVLCGGRLELGLGAGWMTEDYAVSGIVREPAGRRIDRLADTLALLRALRDSAGGPVDLENASVGVVGFRDVPAVPRAPALLVGGGGPRVLGLAAATADVVGINFDVREGHVGGRATRSASAGATDEKVALVRRTAGDRRPVLHLMLYWAAVTERPEDEAAKRIAAAGLDLEPAELLASPHCLIGPRSALRERVCELRERWGFGYVSCYEADLDAVAPLVTGG